MGIGELLTLILAIAKITGYATFGWLTVFLPMIIVYGIVLLIFVLYLLAICVIGR